MKRVLILVEGDTEEAFVKTLLQPHLWTCGVSLEPKIVVTKRVVGGPFEKGGGDFGKIERDLRLLLGDSNAVAVTTLFDFYGFPRNVPGAAPSVFQDIDALEGCVARALGSQHRRLRPYLQRHEFEAFLFVDPQATARAALRGDAAEAVAAHARGLPSVEDIDLGPATAPSKRLQGIFGRFSKPVLATSALPAVGLPRLRGACPRFSGWVGWLESLGASS